MTRRISKAEKEIARLQGRVASLTDVKRHLNKRISALEEQCKVYSQGKIKLSKLAWTEVKFLTNHQSILFKPVLILKKAQIPVP